jgi:hypothetical protein
VFTTILNMKNKHIILFLTCSFCTALLLGQNNFRSGWQTPTLSRQSQPLAFEEKVKARQTFQNQATQGTNALQRLYGFLCLFQDYLGERDYSAVDRCLLEAGTNAHAFGNPCWQGAQSGCLVIIAAQSMISSVLFINRTTEPLPPLFESWPLVPTIACKT